MLTVETQKNVARMREMINEAVPLANRIVQLSRQDAPPPGITATFRKLRDAIEDAEGLLNQVRMDLFTAAPEAKATTEAAPV